jgi:uncharacterized pyridoxamine 5'-phosphate oxidase family protein/ferredoxin
MGRDNVMNKSVEKAFMLLREVKSVAVATLNSGTPDVRIADVMLAERDGLYFITARGKPYYRQIRENPKLAICGMDKNYVSVRVVGDIQFCNDRNTVDKIFEHNPIFDLSMEPPLRTRFAFGGETVNPPGYLITDKCTACGLCLDACPVGVISEGKVYLIDGSHCLECGRCAEVCPEDAINPSEGM